MTSTLFGCGLGRGVRREDCGRSDRRGRQFANPVEVRSTYRLVDADVALEPADVLALLGLDQRDHHAVLACACSPAGTVLVGLVVLWRVVMHDGGNAIHVDSAGCYVSGHQGVDPAAHEVGQSTGALVLAASTVDCRGTDLISCQLLGQTIGAVAGATEDDRGPGCTDCLCSHLNAFVAVHGPEHVGGGGYVGGLVANLVSDRIGLVVPGELGYVAIQGGREQHGLALFGGLVQESTDGRHEAHVSHAVGFVEHYLGNCIEFQGSLVEEVLEATGAGHENLHAVTQCLELWAITDAAVDSADAHLSGEGPEFDADLLGELPCGGQHEGSGPTRLGPLDGGHQRNAEGQGLAGTGRCTAADVTTIECVGDGCRLDGEGLDDAAGLERAGNGIGYAQLGEGG